MAKLLVKSSSASDSKLSEIFKPSAFAALRLIAELRQLIYRQVQLVEKDKLKSHDAQRVQNLLATLNDRCVAFGSTGHEQISTQLHRALRCFISATATTSLQFPANGVASAIGGAEQTSRGRCRDVG